MKRWMIGTGLVMTILVAIFPGFIANDRPILYSWEGAYYCGVCPTSSQVAIPDTAKEILNPLIPYGEKTLEPRGQILSPPLTRGSRGMHWLGTDSQSRDVLAGLIYGVRYAVAIGLLSIFFSLLVGGFLGVMAGYFGDDRYRISIWALVLALLFFGYGLFHWLYGNAWWPGLMGIALGGGCLFAFKAREKGLSFPWNTLVLKGIDLFDSLPGLFVLLAFAASFGSWGILSLSLVIAFFRWPTFARLSRIEISLWSQSDWIRSLRSLQLSDRYIITRELMGLILTPLSVQAAFGVATAVSIEATLSFLGFGLGVDTMSWGRMLSEARQHFQAWWLVVFPGLALFLFLYLTNLAARTLQQRQGAKREYDHINP